MRLSARMALIAVASSAGALVVFLATVWPGLRTRAIEQTRQTLLAEARFVSRVVAAPLARGGGPREMDALVDEAARDLAARVTVIDLQGRVLGDSSASGAELLAIENHRDRPEVRQALRAGDGHAVRRSATVGVDLLYVAVRVTHDGAPVGTARVARAMSAVDAQARMLRQSVLIALLFALAFALAASALLSASSVRSLQSMMHAARRFAGGDLDARATVARNDEIGALARIFNQSADEQQARLEEIARARARHDAILKAMAEGVLAVDSRGTVILASEAFRRDFESPQALGRHYLEVVRQREISDLLEAVLDDGEARTSEVEVWPLRRVFAITVVPFPDAEGKAMGAVATFHDLTERRRIDQIRRDFVANASHELRTPLTAIRGFVEALEDGAVSDPATATRFLGKIRTHAERMTALMDDLLELSRLESGSRPPQWETVQVAELIEDVSASFAATAARKNLRLSAAPGETGPVVTDPDRLRRILECLADNAVKYTPGGGEVRLSGRATAGGGVAVDVKDDGPGIPAEHLPRIFERFYRVDKARSRELGGTGLGLAIAKHLAEGMGATLSVTSQVGRGSCFTVTLPARPSLDAAL